MFFSRRIPGTPVPEENLANDYLIDRSRQRYETMTGIASIPAQDRAVTERMVPAPGGSRAIVDRTRENLGSVDAVVLLRERLVTLVTDLEKGLEPAAARDGSVYSLRAPAIELATDQPFDPVVDEYLSCGPEWRTEDVVDAGRARG